MALKVLKLLLITAATWLIVRPLVRGEGGSHRDDEQPPLGVTEREA